MPFFQCLAKLLTTWGMANVISTLNRGAFLFPRCDDPLPAKLPITLIPPIGLLKWTILKNKMYLMHLLDNLLYSVKLCSNLLQIKMSEHDARLFLSHTWNYLEVYKHIRKPIMFLYVALTYSQHYLVIM